MDCVHTQGLIAAVYTPMSGDGSINLDVIGDYAAFLQRNGVRGAFVCGTTGVDFHGIWHEYMCGHWAGGGNRGGIEPG